MVAQRSGAALPDFGAAADEAQHEASEAAAHLAEGARLLGAADPALSSYFVSFTRHASPEDLIRYTGAELAALVKRVFVHSAERKPGTSLIDIFEISAEDPSFARNETVVLAVNDDIPFLFDSCIGEIRAQGVVFAAVFHPVMPETRDSSGRRAPGGSPLRESVIVVALEGALTPDRAAALRQGLNHVFSNVRAAVRDWKSIVARLAETIAQLKENPPEIPASELSESIAFLAWLADNHFTFLGSRDYAFSSKGEPRLDPIPETGLGLLADPTMRILRRGPDRTKLTPDELEFLSQPSPLIIAKSSFRANVHRRTHMDYVGIKRFDSGGRLIGERRFIGLFTSTAYSQRPSEIPLLRRKTAIVMERSGFAPASHVGKTLQHILDTYPRDELFQIAEDELLATALGILNLGQRPKVRVFLRFDKFDRFVSVLVFIPRERYSGAVRHRIHALLTRAFNGRESAAMPMLDDEALARIHYIVGRNDGPRPEVEARELEAAIRAAIRTWDDGFADAMLQTYGAMGSTLAQQYAEAFPAGYRDTFSPQDAVEDIERVEAVRRGQGAGVDLAAHIYRSGGDGSNALRLKLFVRGRFVPLSDCLPVFENLGLKVIAEDSFLICPHRHDGGSDLIALQNFLMEHENGTAGEVERLKPLLEDAYHAVHTGYAESDGFNRLVTVASLPWRDITILRAAAKFLRQGGITFSQALIEAALAKNSGIAVKLVELFHALHDPSLLAKDEARAEAAAKIRTEVETALDAVPSADDDRILRALMSVIDAVLRTNFFQAAENGDASPSLAFKLDSRKLDFLPQPKPLCEIFVYSRDFEGVHLRFGRIARGGIRWSDRAEDFRTEVLGLVKAQQVKNAVIVPVGAKGGFYPKHVPPHAPRETVQAIGIAAYKAFIGALLDLTDNIGPDGEIDPPERMVRYDSDDPYLVVAADKGTASFSDIANAIAAERGFWLGDAFASGGSRGYDHKKMGITARGAWEAVKRHFREMGRDVQTQPFTCIGVGDMSGDVFGNGMLMSKETKLLAAFDHRHIFIDPSPDSQRSYAERQRLFDLPRSSWADYDTSVISKGGGVFARTAKSIPLSDEMKAMTGLSKERATPNELIRALLTAEVDLLFFGGIGTFIKSSAQSHGDVGDRANDSLRVDGRDIRAAVIGEGANLGATQLGRIEYAREGGPDRKGGRVDTDAIDNSAGVDTSDHEVNIKILMSGPLRRGELTEEERDSMLAAMTDDVARLVLANNYAQTLALSVAQATAARDLDASARFMRELEREGALDRQLEALPDDDGLRALAREGKGLARPEIAVLLAYAKLDLEHAVIESELPDDPYFLPVLARYFPPLAIERFRAEIPRHRLAREIVAMELVNRMVNLAGPLFGHRMRELSSAPLWAAVRAFVLADGAFGLQELNGRIAALDLKVPAATQIAMVVEIGELLRRLGLWFQIQLPSGTGLGDTIETYRAGLGAVKARLAALASPLDAEEVESRKSALLQEGVPADVAEDVAILPLLGAAPEIVLLSQSENVDVGTAAAAYFAVGGLVGLDRLRVEARAVATGDHWDRLAIWRIVDDLYAAQRLLARDALRARTGRDGAEAVDAWAAERADALARVGAFLDDIGRGSAPSIAKLALANSQIQKLAAGPA